MSKSFSSWVILSLLCTPYCPLTHQQASLVLLLEQLKLRLALHLHCHHRQQAAIPLFPGPPPHPLVSWLSPLSNLFPTQQRKCGLKTQFMSCHSSALNLMQLLIASREKTKLRAVALGILQNLVPAYFFILIECHLPLTGNNGFLSPPQICQLLLQGLFTYTFWNVLPPALTVMTPTNFLGPRLHLVSFMVFPHQPSYGDFTFAIQLHFHTLLISLLEPINICDSFVSLLFISFNQDRGFNGEGNRAAFCN